MKKVILLTLMLFLLAPSLNVYASLPGPAPPNNTVVPEEPVPPPEGEA